MNDLSMHWNLPQKTTGLVKLAHQYLQQKSFTVLSCERQDQTESNLHELTGLLSHAPIAIAATCGADHIIHFANPQFAQLCDRPIQALMGKPLREVLPEMVAQIGTEPYAQVYFNGVPFTANAVLISAHSDALESNFYDFKIQPRLNQEGHIVGLLIYGVNMSDRVRDAHRIEQLEIANEQLQLINEELQTTVEELQFQCEEIDAVSEELQRANEDMRIMSEELQQHSDRVNGLRVVRSESRTRPRPKARSLTNSKKPSASTSTPAEFAQE